MINGVLDFGDDESRTGRFDGPIAKVKYLFEVLAGVDMQNREGKLLWREGLRRQVKENGGVFTARKEQHRSFALSHDLSKNKESVGLKNVEMVGSVGGVQGRGHVSLD